METPASFLKQRAPDRPVADVLAEVFRKRILDGEYLPGQRLVEAEICKLYGVSRGPVREAFRRLIAEGLLEAEKYKSPVVRGVGKQQFQQIFEVRAVLEGYAAALAARNVARAPIRRSVQKLLTRWVDGDFAAPQAFVTGNTAFHEAVLKAASHPVLEEQIERLAIPGYKAVFTPALTPRDVEVSSRQHIAILEAILASDATRAERAMRDHVLDTSVRVSANFRTDLFDLRLREIERLKSDAVA